MDKQNLILLCKEHFSTANNCLYLHLNGSDVFVGSLPNFYNLHMECKRKYTMGSKVIEEKVCVPYSSVVFVTLTNFENLDIIAENAE